MSARYGGLDPGRTGALVVVGDDGATVLEAQQWRDQDVPPLFTVLGGVACVALELPYHGEDPHAALVLAHWCGWAHRELVVAGVRVVQPLAVSWRARVLKGPRLRRKPAKAMAIAAAAPYLAAVGIVDTVGDPSEAWCLARYACFWAKSHAVTDG